LNGAHTRFHQRTGKVSRTGEIIGNATKQHCHIQNPYREQARDISAPDSNRVKVK
jgi:hypothetical protein